MNKIPEPLREVLLTRIMQRTEEVFHDRTKEGIGVDTPCYEFQGARDEDGYPIVKVRGRVYRAHRLLMVAQHGSLSSDEYVLHACDNPSCVRMDHLEVGTARDNMVAKFQRNRANVKMTWHTVGELRERYGNGERQKDLAREYGISDATVSQIVNRKTWL